MRRLYVLYIGMKSYQILTQERKVFAKGVETSAKLKFTEISFLTKGYQEYVDQQ